MDLVECECGSKLPSSDLDDHRKGSWHRELLKRLRSDISSTDDEEDEHHLADCETDYEKFYNMEVTCECGATVHKNSLKVHLKSKKHKKFLRESQRKQSTPPPSPTPRRYSKKRRKRGSEDVVDEDEDTANQDASEHTETPEAAETMNQQIVSEGMETENADEDTENPEELENETRRNATQNNGNLSQDEINAKLKVLLRKAIEEVNANNDIRGFMCVLIPIFQDLLSESTVLGMKHSFDFVKEGFLNKLMRTYEENTQMAS
eukprot:m.35695 g.35695  ORF g.35695 m.35695 type:complete len:262 (+) comp8930_c0_seq1:194-979(+)